ncbi:MAG: L-histidine N(alpha)-methyltransferase [Bryobacteraceae bacterium]|nr:L-histidine N(alpha)-methyltransferase [Bryobacteraceae bacterium]
MIKTAGAAIGSNGAGAEALHSAFARDVRAGLSRPGQKELPSKYLYDDLGSALFEAITYLPEYGVTRADERLIRHLSGDLPGYLPQCRTIAELGSGSGRKTRYVLEAFAARGRPQYLPIDVSRAALERCRRDLEDVADVTGFEDSYLDGLRQAVNRRDGAGPLLLLFLGSNIGNFDRYQADDFLKDVRRLLSPGDALLLGVDLEKAAEVLIEGYDDPTGVTAAFNLNLLGRINRELGSDFDLRAFRHQARYNRGLRRVEMHLVSVRDQTVRIPEAGFVCRMRADETIWTEASHKYALEELAQMAAGAGFRSTRQWVDAEWPFAENLWIAG